MNNLDVNHNILVFTKQLRSALSALEISSRPTGNEESNLNIYLFCLPLFV